MSEEFSSLHELALNDPLGARDSNSTNPGKTMIIDKGMGIVHFRDLLETAGVYIDYIKLGFGTAALYPTHILHGKIRLAKEYQVDIYPGGTFFEVAFKQDKVKEYFSHMKQLGFNKIEISDGTIDIPADRRQEAIKLANKMEFEVITEYGKKVEGSQVELETMMETIFADLHAGASHVIIEGRESGENVGIYQNDGKLQDQFEQIVKAVTPYQDVIIWEAPKKNQQVELMKWFGPNVNLGNIAPEDIFSVESLRRGLRSDTFFLTTRRE